MLNHRLWVLCLLVVYCGPRRMPLQETTITIPCKVPSEVMPRADKAFCAPNDYNAHFMLPFCVSDSGLRVQAPEGWAGQHMGSEDDEVRGGHSRRGGIAGRGGKWPKI